METWYFAYGSNLLADQMLARVGSIGCAEQPTRVVRLAGYRLVFQRFGDGPTYANILAPGNGVLGVAYRLSAAQLTTMDRYEARYERRIMKVTDRNGEDLEVTAYVMQPNQVKGFGKPSDAYLERIVVGARQHGLPEEYVENILSLAKS